MPKVYLEINGVRYRYVPEGEKPTLNKREWHFPVGDERYPPEKWYAAQQHGPTHTGLDLNLDMAPWGDIERLQGLGVYALADGVLTYSTPDWAGVPMVVIRHEHAGAWLWIRYAHIGPALQMDGMMVDWGERLGGFANWKTGDHLHIDGALDPFTREWLDLRIRWVDLVPIFKEHLDPVLVDRMLQKGG